MHLTPWLQRFQNSFVRRTGKTRRCERIRRSRSSASFVPAEVLEERTLLSAITVNSLADGTLGALAGDGRISLREAIQAANTDSSVDGSTAGSGADTIQFDSSLIGGTITLAGTELTITGDLTISGPGAGQLTISGNNASRILTISAGSTVQLTGLSLTQGNETDPLHGGGAILNDGGTLTINASHLLDNVSDDFGGAIDNVHGTLQIVGSRITDNGANLGGGIHSLGSNAAPSSVTVRDSTITDNEALIGLGAGGIHMRPDPYSDNAGTLLVSGSTISDNQGSGIVSVLAAVTVESSVIAGNVGSSGGGIRSHIIGSATAGLTVTDSVISANQSWATSVPYGPGPYEGGGGIYWVGPVAITGSTISDNVSYGLGGGIALPADRGGGSWSATITDSRIINNRGDSGGGVFGQGKSTLTIDHTLVADNESVYYGGGGIAFEASSGFGALNIRHSQIVRNSTYQGVGGGIYAATDLMITDSTIADNRARLELGPGRDGEGARGGGMFLLYSARIYSSTISGNSASGDGGGIFFTATLGVNGLYLVNSTVSGNSAADDGGGIVIGGIGNTGNLLSFNSTIVLNRADADGNGDGLGGGVVSNTGSMAFLYNTLIAGNGRGAAATPDDISGDSSSVYGTNSLVGDTSSAGGLTNGANGNIVGNNGAGTLAVNTIIDTNLADNGGPTLTHALLLGSPAVDHGYNGSVWGSRDQRGAVRILDGNADGVSTVDIGAVELVTIDGTYQYLTEQIGYLGDFGGLRQGDERALLTLLAQSENRFDSGNETGSISLLNAFILRVDRLVLTGNLAQDQGEALKRIAQTLIDEIRSSSSSFTSALDAVFAERLFPIF